MTSHQNMNPLKDWTAETTESIAARLEAAKASQAQIRLTLGTMAVISVMMLIASYNAYLSYDYNWITKRCPETITADEPNVLTKQAYSDWAASRIVMISLLGIRVSVDDAAVLGTAVLFVLSLWLLLVARRENHTIGFLLRDTDTSHRARNGEPSVTPSTERPPELDSDGKRWLIYHTIISNSLFVIFDRLQPVRTLAGPNSLMATTEDKDKDDGWLDRVGLSLIRSFFFCFPVIACLVVFGLDSWSYFGFDPFSSGCEGDGATTFFRRTRVLFLMFWIPLTICCIKSNRYSRLTERVLHKYGRRLSAYYLKRKQTAKS
jgi:hypothetical protein